MRRDPRTAAARGFGILATPLVLITNDEVGKLDLGRALAAICANKAKLGEGTDPADLNRTARREANETASEMDLTTY